MVASSNSWTFIELIQFFGPRILFAIICGGLVGVERELRNKPAGLKTNILICLGSTLYTSVSVLISANLADSGHYGDPGRVAAQIVSGIGFLGGGAIMQSRGTVLGLTTAATIWMVAAIGICIGIGHSDIGVLCAVTTILVLTLTTVFEDRVLGRALTFACEIIADDPKGQVRLSINQSLAHNNLVLDDFDIGSRGELSVLSCKYSGHRLDHKKFVLELWSTPGIREVRQL
jgi:putative Mg2+ transporter-C (MgtC) family protein